MKIEDIEVGQKVKARSLRGKVYKEGFVDSINKSRRGRWVVVDTAEGKLTTRAALVELL